MEDDLRRDIAEGSSANRPIRVFLRRCRAWVERHPRIRLGYRIFVAVLGTLIIAVGAILIPLPGPGWLIVFVGFGVLGTEFAAARRVASWLRAMLARFFAWWKHRRAERADAA